MSKQISNTQLQDILGNVKELPPTIEQKNIKTNTSIQLTSSLQIKVTTTIQHMLEEKGLITRFTGSNKFFPTRDRRDDIITLLTNTPGIRRINSSSPMASPWRFCNFHKNKVQ